MIRLAKLDDINKLRPLIEEFYLEQRAYKESFNWDYICQSLQVAIEHPQYVVFTDDVYKCLMVGHTGSNPFIPVNEGYEDCIFVHPKFRGSRRFLTLLQAFEKWCKDQGTKYINVGVHSGIMNDTVEDMYAHCGYKRFLTGFKKGVL